MSYCNQTLFLSVRVGSGHETKGTHVGVRSYRSRDLKYMSHSIIVYKVASLLGLASSPARAKNGEAPGTHCACV